MEFYIKNYEQYADGKIICTKLFQDAIDQCAPFDTLVLPKGTFKVGSLFLKDHLTLVFGKQTVLLGSNNIDDFKEIDTRVAGVEMKWPAAILNVIDAYDVTIKGTGFIDGQGPIWWERYWGKNKQGGARSVFDKKNLRWIVDYEVKRPRTILIYNSEQVCVQDLNLRQAGFWNLQITYSKKIHINGLTIKDNTGPSTDGIDIDSSNHVLIENCELACGDDCIVIKSGRDGDGLRINRPSENIEIKNCEILEGYGVVIGSEISGGVSNVHIHDITFKNSSCGFRMKSSAARGGFITDVKVERLTMTNVQFPFSWLMNWHPSYNRKDFDRPIEEMPAAWQAVAAQIPEYQQKSLVSNITVRDVSANLTDDYHLPSRAFDIGAYSDKPMTGIVFENIKIKAQEFGKIVAVKNLNFKNVIISTESANSVDNDHFDNR